METETTDQPRQDFRHEPCLCSIITGQILNVFGVRSEEARQHVRNARIEMLKAMRSMIDERINDLSRVKAKGSKINVE